MTSSRFYSLRTLEATELLSFGVNLCQCEILDRAEDVVVLAGVVQMEQVGSLLQPKRERREHSLELEQH